MAVRERIASEVLGSAVVDGATMPCLFAEQHTHSSGPRDMRVCLAEKGDSLPTFHCFHGSCKGSWAPLNKELRSKIWFAENGIDRSMPKRWESGVAQAPRAKCESEVFSYETLEALRRKDWVVNREWFRQRSPVDPAKCTHEGFLKALFPAGQKVIIFTTFKSQGQFLFWSGKGSYRLADKPGVKAVPSALPRGGPEGVWYLCSPVDGQWYPNPRAPLVRGEIQMSRRSIESVDGVLPFLVLECDHKEKACPCDDCKGRDNPNIMELWTNFLAQLPLPIAAVYTSAGKSIHALVRVDAKSKAGWEKYKMLVKKLCVKCGADVKAMSAVRLTRLPGCMRGDRLQELLYLNPHPDPSGIPIGEGGNICG